MKKLVTLSIEDSVHEKGKKDCEKLWGFVNFSEFVSKLIKEYESK